MNVMKQYLILLVLILTGSLGFGQTAQKETKPYTARILLTHGEKVKGTLWSATEVAIVLEDRKTQERTRIDPAQVEWIKVRRQGRVGRGILIGAGSGLLLGGVFSAAGVWDNPIFEILPNNESREVKNEATAELMLGGAALGGAIGALVGSKSEIFVVQGNVSRYASALPLIRAYTREYRMEMP
jgi:hypothetical protein